MHESIRLRRRIFILDLRQYLFNDELHSSCYELQTRHVDCAVYFAEEILDFLQRIDELISEAYVLSSLEADYISNYDIKYRLGQHTGNDDD